MSKIVRYAFVGCQASQVNLGLRANFIWCKCGLVKPIFAADLNEYLGSYDFDVGS